MPAPTQLAGSPFQTSTWTTGVPKAVVVGAVGVGDLVLVGIVTEDSSADPAIPTNSAGSPATVVWTAGPTVTAGSRCRMEMYSGSVTVAGNLTVSVASGAGISGSTNWGDAVVVFPAGQHGGLGLSTSGNAAGTAPTASQAWSANSFLFCVNGDWTAVSHGGPRSYRVGAGAATEINYANVDSNYTTEAWYHADTGAGGSQAVGLTTPNMTWSLGVMEVLASAGGAAPRPQQSRRVRGTQMAFAGARFAR